MQKELILQFHQKRCFVVYTEDNLTKTSLTAICQSTILTTNYFQKERRYGKTYTCHNVYGHYIIREYASGVCF